jgi:hypothetical protein
MGPPRCRANCESDGVSMVEGVKVGRKHAPGRPGAGASHNHLEGNRFGSGTKAAPRGQQPVGEWRGARSRTFCGS